MIWLKKCSNCGELNDDAFTICTSCGYTLPVKSRKFRKAQEENLPQDPAQRYSFSSDEKEIATFRPSVALIKRLSRSSLVAGILPGAFVLFAEDQILNNIFTLSTIILIATTVVFVWAVPSLSSYFTWRRVIKRTEYVITNKRVILNQARNRGGGPSIIDLQDISYLKLSSTRGLFSNVFIFTKKLVGPGSTLPQYPDLAGQSVDSGTILPNSPSMERRQKMRETLRTVRNLRRSSMLYLTHEDSVKAEELIYSLIGKKES